MTSDPGSEAAGQPSQARHPGHVCQGGRRWHAGLSALVLGLLLGVTGAACAGEAARGAAAGPAPLGEAGAAGAGPSRDAAVPLGRAAVENEDTATTLIPRPRQATACVGKLVVDGATEIVIDEDPDVRAVAARLAAWMDIPASRVRVIPAGAPGPSRAIVLRLDPSDASSSSASGRRDPALEPPRDAREEAYVLDISPERALLRAPHPAGLFYGAQALAQLAGSRPIVLPPALAVAHASAPPATFSSGPPAQVAPAPAPPPPGAAPPRQDRVLPCVHVEDAPGQRVRAMHLDVARHFFSRELVERYIDILAFYRYNVFHWHLTDDQGFRLTVRSHPELTRIGGKRVEDGREQSGAYTQDDVRAVVAWAKERFVTVVPEIEMPGHARAILASHPELSCTGKKLPVPSTWGVFDDVLCAGNPGSFALLGDILGETMELFPSRLVHVGGDEVPKTRWNACPRCRARMAKERLTAEQLQGAFMKRAGQMLAAGGRRMVAWDDALEGGLAPDAVVVAWQNAERGRVAAVAGQDVVLAPSETNYFNYWQSRSRTEPGHEGFIPWQRVLSFDPRPAGLSPAQAAHVLGGEAAMWTEHIRTADELDAMLLPRLAALSEALWRTAAPAGAPAAVAAVAAEEAFVTRFAASRRMLDASRVRYFVEPPLGLRARKVLVDEASLVLAPPSLHPEGVVRFTLDGSDPSPSSPVFTGPVALRATTSVAARLFLAGGRASEVVRGSFVRTGLAVPIHPSRDPATLTPGATYDYFEGDFHRLPDFAHLAAKRSGRLGALGFDAAFRAERFGVVYSAWVIAAEDGVYRFVAQADDGVTVDVDGVRVVEDDGEHAARDAEGEMALARGPHTVRVGYFQGSGGKHLALSCEGPRMPLGPCRLVSP